MDTERLLYEAAYLWSYYDHFCASDIAVDPAYDILKHLINIVFCILDLSFVSYIKAINIKYSHISFPHNFFIEKNTGIKLSVHFIIYPALINLIVK